MDNNMNITRINNTHLTSMSVSKDAPKEKYLFSNHKNNKKKNKSFQEEEQKNDDKIIINDGIGKYLDIKL